MYDANPRLQASLETPAAPAALAAAVTETAPAPTEEGGVVRLAVPGSAVDCCNASKRA